MPPHTFFKYIFLNKKKLEANEIPMEVLLHEETHAQQKHSWDVVFVEFLQVLFWCNPFLYFTKKAIKLNHEFLADQAVLNKDIDESTYQNTLLSYLSPDSKKKYKSTMANAITNSSYSSIKKRFKVMKKQTSKKAVLFRSLLLLPLLATLVYGFSETELVETPIEILNRNTTTDEFEKFVFKFDKKGHLFLNSEIIAQKDLAIKLSDISISELTKAHIYAENGTDDDINKLLRILWNAGISVENVGIITINEPEQKGATKEQIAEYNTLAKSHHLFSDFNLRPRESEIRNLTRIYNLMTEEQKNNAQIFPQYPPTQDGATKKQLVEYNRLAKKYNQQKDGERSLRIEDLGKIYSIYGLMTKTQKNTAEPFPNIPPPPPPTDSSQEEIDAMKTYKTANGETVKIIKDATPKELKEYNKLAKKYNTMLSKSKSIQIKMQDVERLEYLYGIMSDEQKAAAEAFPNFPEPPPMPKAPGAPEAPKVKNDIPPPPPSLNPNEPYKEKVFVGGDGYLGAIDKPDFRFDENTEIYHNGIRISQFEMMRLRNAGEITSMNVIKKPGQFDRIELTSIQNQGGTLNYVYITQQTSLEKQEIAMEKSKKALKKQETALEHQETSLKKNELALREHEAALKQQEIALSNQEKALHEMKISPPTPPKSPLDHVLEMAQKNAIFYYENKEISSDKAVDILKKNKNINIDTRSSNENKPTVRLSKKPIKVG